MKRRPFEEGWDAGVRGYSDPRVICPYQKQTAEWKEWHKFYFWGKELHDASAEKQKTLFAKLAKRLGVDA